MQMERIRHLSDIEKNKIIKKLKGALQQHKEISFAFIHGSFIKGNGFRDIDIAVFLNHAPKSLLEYELNMEAELTKVSEGNPVDIRVLNSSCLSFRYHVIKEGSLLCVKDDDVRSDFQEKALLDYFDFKPYLNIYLRETLGFGV